MVKYVDWKILVDCDEFMTLWSYWWWCWHYYLEDFV